MTQTEKKKLFVHIGMHKTGSTSIQYAMVHAATDLALAGILYPMTGRHPIAHVQHDLVFLALNPIKQERGIFEIEDMPDEAELLNALREEIETSGCHTVVLSAENLWTLGPNEVKRFAEHFGDFEIIPVCFVRSTADLVESLYLTNSRIEVTDRDGESLGFKFWEPYLGMDLRVYIARWGAIASDGKVRVHFYSSGGTDSVLEFWRIIGLPEALRPVLTHRLNPTQSIMSEFIRLICNRYGVEKASRDALMAQYSRLKVQARLTLMPPDVRQAFDKNFKSQAEALVDGGTIHFTGDPFSDFKSGGKPIFLDGMLTALFVIGAAIK